MKIKPHAARMRLSRLRNVLGKAQLDAANGGNTESIPKKTTEASKKRKEASNDADDEISSLKESSKVCGNPWNPNPFR